jgi:SH3 domain-containing protein
MRNTHYLLLIIFLFASSVSDGGTVAFVQAQEGCNVDTAEVMEVVGDVCAGIGENQVCYGNFDVSVDILDNVLGNNFNFSFQNPGDITDLANIESLYLSALNPEEESWGIAQMRLTTAAKWGTQDLNLLLFGDVEISSAIDSTRVVEVRVSSYPSNIRNLPSTDALVLGSVDAGTILEAVGRLEDSSWLRVRTATGSIGWIATKLVVPAKENESIAELDVQDSSSPYFGPMQAFYFEQGSGSDCSNVTADGLLVQTPQGSARVSVSINGVNIELLAGQSGTTALIQGGINSDMTISVIEGSSVVEAGGVSYNLLSGIETSIAIAANGVPLSPPRMPSNFNVAAVSNLPALSLVNSVRPLAPTRNNGNNTTNTGGNNNNTTTNTGGNNNNNNSTNTGGNNNNTTTNTGGNNNNNNSTNTGGNNNNPTNISGNNNNPTNIGGNINNLTNGDGTTVEDKGFSISNILAAIIALVATVAMITATVVMARINRH